MDYIVKLYSKSYNILNGVTFDDKTQTALHIMKIITDSKVPLEIGVERLYSKDDTEILTAIIYHIHQMR